MESVLCLYTTPKHKTFPVMWLTYPILLHWQRLISPLPTGINCKQLLSLCWHFVCFVPIFSVLAFCLLCSDLLCAVSVSLSSYVYQFSSVWKMLFPCSHLQHLTLIIFLPSVPSRSLSLERNGFIQTSHLQLSSMNSLSTYTLCNCVSIKHIFSLTIWLPLGLNENQIRKRVEIKRSSLSCGWFL